MKYEHKTEPENISMNFLHRKINFKTVLGLENR